MNMKANKHIDWFPSDTYTAVQKFKGVYKMGKFSSHFSHFIFFFVLNHDSNAVHVFFVLKNKFNGWVKQDHELVSFWKKNNTDKVTAMDLLTYD